MQCEKIIIANFFKRVKNCNGPKINIILFAMILNLLLYSSAHHSSSESTHWYMCKRDIMIKHFLCVCVCVCVCVCACVSLQARDMYTGREHREIENADT